MTGVPKIALDIYTFMGVWPSSQFEDYGFIQIPFFVNERTCSRQNWLKISLSALLSFGLWRNLVLALPFMARFRVYLSAIVFFSLTAFATFCIAIQQASSVWFSIWLTLCVAFFGYGAWQMLLIEYKNIRFLKVVQIKDELGRDVIRMHECSDITDSNSVFATTPIIRAIAKVILLYQLYVTEQTVSVRDNDEFARLLGNSWQDAERLYVVRRFPISSLWHIRLCRIVN